jgi:hypothetical protein
MKRFAKVIIGAVVLFLFAQRLPAPISEVETPTPTPEQPAKPKPKRTIKPEATSKSSESSTKRQTPSPATQLEQHPKFAGTWRGMVHLGSGDFNMTFVVNNEGTLITESGGWVDGSHPGSHNGDVMIWRSGGFNAIGWTLTPEPDGKTAILTVKGPIIGNNSAVLRKISP